MSYKNEFPHPVLTVDNDDYIESCSFGSEIDAESILTDDKNIIIPLKYELQSKSLTAMLENKSAVVVALVRSSGASYGRVFRFHEGKNTLNIEVPKFSVIDKIEITCSIVASKDIVDYTSEEYNKIYFEGFKFNFRKGDLLATEDARTVYIDDNELEKSVSSIFTICKSDSYDNDLHCEFGGDKITIFLKPDTYDTYNFCMGMLNGALKRNFTVGVVGMPLVEAVGYVIGHYMNESEEEYDLSDKRWFRVIEHKSKSLNIGLEDYAGRSAELANAILNNIVLDGLKCTKVVLEKETEEDETPIMGGVD